MRKHMKKARVGAALIGVGAVVAAGVLPGTVATADDASKVTSYVTRAVLAQGDVNGNIDRATLISQMTLDGQGQASFSVPVAPGGSPSNMDSFGAPTVSGGAAQYNVTVNGPQTFRTSQSYNAGDIPVKISIEAQLNGQPIKPSDLAGKTGRAKLIYHFDNATTEPTQVSYQDATGQTVTEEVEVPTPIAGSVTMIFDSSWAEMSAPSANALIGNGTGGTELSTTVALVPPPFGEVKQDLVIEGRVQNAVIPSFDGQFPVVSPAINPTMSKLTGVVQGGGDAGKEIYQGGVELGDGLMELKDGLVTAASGATEIADGSAKLATAVNGTLGPGVAELNEGVNGTGSSALVPGVGKLAAGAMELFEKAAVGGAKTASSAAKDLIDKVRANTSYCGPNYKYNSGVWTGCGGLIGALNEINGADALFEVQSSQQKITNIVGSFLDPMPLTSAGTTDTSNATAEAILSTLIFGIQKNASGKSPASATAGFTNPRCDASDPAQFQNKDNPCGMVQILDYLLENLDWHLPTDLAGWQAMDLGGNALLAAMADAFTVGTNPGGTPTEYPAGSGQTFLGGLIWGNGIRDTGVAPLATMLGCTQAAAPAPDNDYSNCVNAPNPADAATYLNNIREVAYDGTSIFGIPIPSLQSALQAFQLKLGNGVGYPSCGFKDGSGAWPYLPTQNCGPSASTGATGTMRYALDRMRAGLSGDIAYLDATPNMYNSRIDFPNSGWPEGCQGPQGAGQAYPDKFGCNFSPMTAGALLEFGDETATGTLGLLGVTLGKSDANPQNQIPQSSGQWADSLVLGVCPGPEAPQSQVAVHCSAKQVLTFLSAGISGANPTTPTYGKVDPGCPYTDASKEAAIKSHGIACAVKAIEYGVDRTLIPTIGDQVQSETQKTIGNGVYSPNCDPTTSPTLTCALSALRFGTGELKSGVDNKLAPGVQQLYEGVVLGSGGTPSLEAATTLLANGTEELAAGLPAAVSGTQKIYTEGAVALETKGEMTAAEYYSQVAVINAMSDKVAAGAGVPGGVPEGVTSYNGVYAFELAGAGGPSGNNLARYGLAILGLAAAGAAGAVLVQRRRSQAAA